MKCDRLSNGFKGQFSESENQRSVRVERIGIWKYLSFVFVTRGVSLLHLISLGSETRTHACTSEVCLE